MSDQQRHTMTEADFDALCKWLESPKGCTFQQEIPSDSARANGCELMASMRRPLFLS